MVAGTPMKAEDPRHTRKGPPQPLGGLACCICKLFNDQTLQLCANICPCINVIPAMLHVSNKWGKTQTPWGLVHAYHWMDLLANLRGSPSQICRDGEISKITLSSKKRGKQHATEGDYSKKDILRFWMRYVCLSYVGYFIAFLPSSEADGSQACNLNQ